MSKSLNGRAAIVTGAGRGLGAAYAKRLAAQGAWVIVNDIPSTDGDDPALQVVEEIRSAGGSAIADYSDVANFDSAGALVQRAIAEFGGLDILVNNAGNLRDRMFVNMAERDWDDVIQVHLKGHFCMARHAAAHWKEKAVNGPTDAVLIHTTSIAGLHGNVGQTSYAVAKAGIATLAHVNHLELHGRLGVRVYAVGPGGRTRMTEGVPGAADVVARPADGSFDYFDPDNVAAVVSWLCRSDCPAPSGQVYGVQGDIVRRYDGWRIATTVSNDGRQWTDAELNGASAALNLGADEAFMSMERGLAKE